MKGNQEYAHFEVKRSEKRFAAILISGLNEDEQSPLAFVATSKGIYINIPRDGGMNFREAGELLEIIREALKYFDPGSGNPCSIPYETALIMQEAVDKVDTWRKMEDDSHQIRG